MKTISITIEEGLLHAIDRATRQTRRTRSEVIRAAVKDWLARARWREMTRRDREGYAARAVTADEFGNLVAAQPWLQAATKRKQR